MREVFTKRINNLFVFLDFAIYNCWKGSENDDKRVFGGRTQKAYQHAGFNISWKAVIEMKDYIYVHEAQIRLLGDIFGNKAVIKSLESNRRKAENSIQKALMRLSEKQRLMVLYQYGFIDGNAHTPEETALYLGIGQKEAGQMGALALRTLRSPPCSKELKNLLSLL